jgi:L-iditol 2-dehydrogenase
MKALVYTRPEHLELQDIPKPPVGPSECLIRVRAVGICGSDLHGFLGRSKKRVPPLVLGHEFSGEIVEAGNEVSDLRPGDAVAVYPLVTCGKCAYCTTGRHQICPDRRLYGLDFHGALSEYVSAPRQCIFPLPSGMTFLQGALVEPLANALHVFGGLRAVAGQTGLIYGAGPIGSFIFLVAKHLGAKRLAVVDLNAHRLSTLAKLGADLTINASECDPVEAVLKWTEGRGVDFAVDAVGTSICRRNALACAAPGATLAWIGLQEDFCEIDGRAIVTKEIEIKGSYAYGLQDFARAIALIEQNSLPLSSLITESMFSDGQKVFEELASGSSALTKAVLKF